MKREPVSRLRKAGEKSIGQHDLRPTNRFLGGLGDEHEGAAPAIFHRHQGFGRADPSRHVDVMSAAMGDEGGLASILALRPGRVGNTRLLLHGEGVEFGAHHHHRPWAVAIDRHEPRLADVFGDLKAVSPHLLGQHSGRAGLLESKFRVGVQVFVEGVEPRIVGVEGSIDPGFRRRDIHGGSATAAHGGEQGEGGDAHGGYFLVQTAVAGM